MAAHLFVDQLINDLRGAIALSSGANAALGVRIATYLLLIGATWAWIKVALRASTLPDALSESIRGGVLYLITVGFISGMPWLGVNGGLAKFIESGFLALAPAGGTLGTTVASSLTAFLDVAVDVASMPISNATGFLGTLAAWMKNGITYLLIIVLQGLTAAFVIVAGVLFTASLVLSKIGIDIAAALAPIMLCWMMWRPMSFLANSWIRFMVGTCMTSLLGSILVVAMSGTIANFAATVKAKRTALAGQEITFLDAAQLYSGLLLTAFFFSALAMSMPTIARSIAGAGMGGFSPKSYGNLKKGMGKPGQAAKSAYQGLKKGLGR